MAEESTRRLPPWMVETPSLENTSISTEPSDLILLPKQSETITKKQKRSRIIKRQIDEDTASDRRHGVAGKSTPPKDKQKASRSRRNSREANEPSTSSSPAVDDDFDFSVDDLVSIAQEYVKAEIGDRKSVSESILPQTADLRDDSSNIPVASRAVASCSSHSTASLKSEHRLIGVSGTGDPARDMLDLFLGPLLNKPIGEDKKVEFDIKDESSFVKFRTQSQNDDDHAEQYVPLVKKKTSLKHKVSLLLD